MRVTYAQITMITSLAVSLASPAQACANIGSGNQRKASGVEGFKLRAGEPFLEARSRIIGSGWKPIRMHGNDNYAYDGAEKRLAERGYLEVDTCSIDAGANCILYYGNAEKCLRLDTVGEQVKDMKVTRWTNECPGRK